MYEQNNIPSDETTGRRQDAIDINDFVFAATGARVRRLTMPDGEHWFPAMDVAKHLGYANTRDAVQSAVSQQHTTAFGDIARSVGLSDARRNTAGHGFRTTMKLVNLQGLIELVNGCTKPEAQPFRSWVSEVIATVQRDGSYALEPAAVQPAPSGGTAYVMPDQVAEAIVRLEERNVRADEMILAFQKEQNDLLRRISSSQQAIARSQGAVVEALQDIALALRRGSSEPALEPQQLVAGWMAKNLLFTDDIRTVATFLAPALVQGEASYRMEEIAGRTGLSVARVHDSLRTMLRRGCMRQTGCAPDGAPVYVLP
ncbi:Bro-N domain-containing protein [Streptomyces sp. Amel2xC10]|uniref:BRO-N domain-containing protein n=1 Tax=Streptomyces sp. Amel2xC10 TaxID=1305826 RepID=UPI000A08E994|nr:Bro-N domain-containing protein [Streptomyces sp. Amel2xC10]SMF62277.1 Prophage antirepressor [Streptomyces sp. Amel2xC10]